MRFMRTIALLLLLPWISMIPGCAIILGEIEPIEVRLVNVVPEEMTLFEQRFRVQVRMLNPNNLVLRVSGLKFSLELNGSRFLQAMSSQALSLPRLGDAVTTAQASTTTLGVARQLLEIDPQKPIRYRLAGTVYMEGASARKTSFENKGQIILPELLRSFREFEPLRAR